MGKKYVLLDGYSLIYRAYHALQAPMTAPDGTPTNAAHGFMMMLIKVLTDEHPDGVAAAFDVHAPTRRAQVYAPYKATRKPMPDDLRPQVPLIRELLGAMGIPILELEGYEADDVLGTISLKCEREDREALIVTGDRDSFQLAGAHTTILYTKRGISDTVRVTPDYLKETYGLTPEQMIDLKGLMGDTSDNIPGVPGVGEKTALKLMDAYGSLEAVLDRAEAEQTGKLRERLMTYREQAELSKSLATIDRAVPIDIDFAAMAPDGLSGALPMLRELQMNQAAARLEELCRKLQPDIPLPEAPADLPDVEKLSGREALAARAVELAKTAQWVSVHCGAAFTVATDQARLETALGGDLLDPGLQPEEAWAAVRPLMEIDGAKIVYDVKSVPLPDGAIAPPVHDVMLAAYALNPGRPSFAADRLCEEEGVPGFAAHPATALAALSDIQRQKLESDGLTKLYEDIELPLSRVLRRMEREGFLVDDARLKALGEDFRRHIAELVDRLADEMGERINLNSPKQLGEMLFGKMRLPAPKKTARGWSTSAEVLEGLADRYPVCADILEYRKYQKLESTYIESLLALRDENGRIHTRFDPVGTATGRLSSAEPNLQNIPVRTELGRQIRQAFIARPGWMLVDADYSQIELRVLAHISGDETMISAFREEQDIHARTASEVYGVPLSEVTGQMRSASKAVNFGIVYGISDFALAKNIGVSRAEARAFIDRYFERYPGIRRYMDEAVATGRRQGYVTTLMGRRRYLPELVSSNFNLRQFGERVAMNSPIQGTAADIIKLAMIRVMDALDRQGLRARLILQVHDELIVEAPQDEVAAVQALLKDCMENVVALSVPLKTDISTGGDWCACK